MGRSTPSDLRFRADMGRTPEHAGRSRGMEHPYGRHRPAPRRPPAARRRPFGLTPERARSGGCGCARGRSRPTRRGGVVTQARKPSMSRRDDGRTRMAMSAWTGPPIDARPATGPPGAAAFCGRAADPVTEAGHEGAKEVCERVSWREGDQCPESARGPGHKGPTVQAWVNFHGSLTMFSPSSDQVITRSIRRLASTPNFRS